jgi:hypothetical protein
MADACEVLSVDVCSGRIRSQLRGTFLRTKPHVKAESVDLCCIRDFVRKDARMPWAQRQALDRQLDQTGQRDTWIGEIVDIDRAC